jgi:PAS domain-containing serine/threonine kinase
MKLPDHKSPQQQEDAVHTSTLKKPPPILTFTPPTGVVREGWHGQREPLSPLDQIRPLPQKKLFTFAEPWMEEEEDDDNELFAMTNRLTLTTDSSLQRFKGDGLLSFSYNVIPPSPFQDAAGSSFFSAFSNPLNSSFNIPFLTSPSKDKSSSFLYPTTSRSPNKAIVTINASTSIIMVVNKVANEMFGYRPGQLIGTKIQGLFAAPYQSTQRALTEQHINESGETVLVSGKVMDAITSTGIEFPVSVWMRKVISADEPRVIVVIEPVERCSAYFTINKEGHVVSCDSTFITLFGFDDVDEVVGRNLSLIIPSFSLDKISENQSLTGRTSDGSPFPLTLSLAPQEPPQGIIEPNEYEEDSPSSLWDGMVLVYASLSGMISFFSDGTIHGCNRHFSSMLLGYAQNELIGKDISQVIPDFYSLIQLSISDMWSNNENLSSSIFQSVSETCFDVPLTSISEENEVFVDPLTSSNNTPCHIKEKRDDSFYTSDKDYDDDKDYCDDKEIVIQFKPSVVTIGGVVYNYDESGSDEEVFDVSAGDFLCQENVSSSDDQCDIVSVAQVITNECDVTSIDPEAQTDSTQSHSMTSETQTDSTQSHSMTSETQTDSTHSHSMTSETQTNSVQSHSITSETQTNVHPETQTDSTHSHSMTSETQTNVHPEAQTDSTQSHSMTSKTQTKTTSDPPFFDHHYQPSSSSTPAQRESRPTSRLSSNYGHENLYSSYASHKDGSLLSIIFQFKQIPLAGAIEDGRSLFCIWVMRDNDSIRLKSNDISKVALCSPQSPLEVSSEQLEEQLAVVGEYGLHYDTLGPVGSGAFGFVKLATRRRDNQMVIVKFIRKATVIPEHWVEHETMGLIPREICILAQISHVNVVQLLEAYENEHYFQLVMDKHGDGMDLFTFIESGPYLDEALISYMFRQVR